MQGNKKQDNKIDGWEFWYGIRIFGRLFFLCFSGMGTGMGTGTGTRNTWQAEITTFCKYLWLKDLKKTFKKSLKSRWDKRIKS